MIYKEYEVHSWPNNTKICGENLAHAIDSNLDILLAHSQSDSHLKEIKGYTCEYRPGLLGGSGGVDVAISCFDLLRNAPVVVHASVYATREEFDSCKDKAVDYDAPRS